MKNIRKHELIGYPIEIIDAKNKTLVGIKGTIVDETKNTFKIKTKLQKKTIIKDQITFIIKIKDKTQKHKRFSGSKKSKGFFRKYKIKGKSLAKRPEERLKK